MSTLIVLAFKDPFRAAEVLNDVRRRDWAWVVELDHAVVVRWDEKAKLRVQLSVGPTTKEGPTWARVWGSFLSLAMFIPVADGIGGASREVTAASANL